MIWIHKVPFRSRFIIADTLRAMAATTLVLIGIFTIIGVGTGEPGLILGLLPMLLLTVAGLTVLALLIALFLGHLEVVFEVNEDGAFLRSGRRGRSLGELATFTGLLSDRQAVLAAGLLAQSGADRSILWSEVHRVKVHRGSGVISLADSWHTAMRLYCPPELLPELEETIRARVAAGSQGRVQRPGMGVGGWLAITLAASLAAALGGGDSSWLTLTAGLLAALAGLLARPVSQILAGMALLPAGGALALRVQAIRDSFEVLPPDLVSMLGYLTLLGLLGYQLLRRERPGWETQGT